MLGSSPGPMSLMVLQQKRHQQILTDVVRVYIETGEPVSSRSVAHRHIEPLSPATVRNVMADLEELGYLYQPHTSAGRVPTASAYRFSVEQVAAPAAGDLGIRPVAPPRARSSPDARAISGARKPCSGSRFPRSRYFYFSATGSQRRRARSIPAASR